MKTANSLSLKELPDSAFYYTRSNGRKTLRPYTAPVFLDRVASEIDLLLAQKLNFKAIWICLKDGKKIPDEIAFSTFSAYMRNRLAGKKDLMDRRNEKLEQRRKETAALVSRDGEKLKNKNLREELKPGTEADGKTAVRAGTELEQPPKAGAQAPVSPMGAQAATAPTAQAAGAGRIVKPSTPAIFATPANPQEPVHTFSDEMIQALAKRLQTQAGNFAMAKFNTVKDNDDCPIFWKQEEIPFAHRPQKLVWLTKNHPSYPKFFPPEFEDPNQIPHSPVKSVYSCPVLVSEDSELYSAKFQLPLRRDLQCSSQDTYMLFTYLNIPIFLEKYLQWLRWYWEKNGKPFHGRRL